MQRRRGGTPSEGIPQHGRTNGRTPTWFSPRPADMVGNFLGRYSTILLSIGLICGIQCFWIVFDQSVSSRIVYAVPRKYVPPSLSSPISPYYSDPFEPYKGPSFASPSHPFPCRKLVSDRDFQSRSSTGDTGFFFMTQPHMATSTLFGVAARMARNVASRQHPAEIQPPNRTACLTRILPIKAKRLKVRDRQQTFLWTMVREPVDRILSKFFHKHVSLEGQAPTADNLMRFLEDHFGTEYGNYFKLLTPRRHVNAQRTELYASYTKEIFETIDFVGVLERFDESLAALQVLLGLETKDMLYLSANGATLEGGASYNYDSYTSKCTQLQRKEVTMPLKEYLYRPYLYEGVFQPDVYFYQAANASLDRTIESLGRDRVHAAQRKLEWAQQKAKEHCSHVRYACSDQGEPQATNDCFSSGMGCGYSCLDEVANLLGPSDNFGG